MEKKKMSKSLRKHIRQEKARIRRAVLDIRQQKELISQLYQKILKKDENRRDLQPSNK